MKNLIVTALLMLPFIDANAHGTNKLGPNGGYIRMPSTYHLELVQKDDLTQVYFLDMHFKTLSTKDSSLHFVLKGANDLEVPCVNRDDHFECDTKLKKAEKFKAVELKSSVNPKAKVFTTQYDLPLMLK